MNKFIKTLPLILLPLTSGCLVKSPDQVDTSQVITIKTDSLHIYQTGQRIDYDVNGSTNNGERYNGYLSQEWKTPYTTVTHPSGTPRSDLLAENWVLTQYQDTANSELANVTRYISQSSIISEPGAYSIAAIEDISAPTTPPTPLWLNESHVYIPPVDIREIAATINTQMPASSVNYYIKEDCSELGCTTENAQMTIDYTNINATEDVPTAMGTIQAHRFEYSGSLTSFTGSPPPIYDIRTECANLAVTAVEFTGSYWIHPSIGIIKIRNVCTADNGVMTTYTATLSNTQNIPIN